MTKKRIEIIDAMKGFAILLVVFGHAIQGNVVNFDNNIFFRIIYAFHMPLFMFLAGAVAKYSLDNSVVEFLKKKFYALVIPFAVWYGVAYFANGYFHSVAVKTYLVRVILSPDWGLWFLWVLFLNFCFLVLAVKMEKGLGIFAFLVTLLLVEWAPFGIAGIGLAKTHFLYFILGYLFMRYKDEYMGYLHVIKYSALIIFPLYIFQWHRIGGFSFVRDLHRWLSLLGPFNFSGYVALGCTLALAISGIACSYLLIGVLQKVFIYDYLKFLGGYTLDIYVSHQLFLKYGFGDGFIKVITTAAIALLISMALSVFILRRNKVLNMIFLGGRKKVNVGENAGLAIFRNLSNKILKV